MTHPKTTPARPPATLAAFTTAALLSACFALPASAQIVPTGTPAADILLSQAIAEHRVFLTCSALDPATHAQILQNWQRDVTDAAAILAANAVPAAAIAAFENAARPENLLPATDTTFAEVKELCEGTPDWQTDYFQLNISFLPIKLPKAFE
jgi:hypothetical protein